MTPDYEALIELMRARRSVRRFRPEPVPPELVERMLEAARWAPSAGNRQAHRFLAVTSAPLVASMAESVRRATARLAENLRPDLAEQAGAYLTHFHHFEGAPLVLVAIYRTGFDLLRAVASDSSPDLDPPGTKPVVDALASVSAAVMNLLLAAHALGLGACWMTGPLIAARELAELLQVPHGWELAALVPVGYAAEQPAEPTRRALEQLVRRVD